MKQGKISDIINHAAQYEIGNIKEAMYTDIKRRAIDVELGHLMRKTPW